MAEAAPGDDDVHLEGKGLAGDMIDRRRFLAGAAAAGLTLGGGGIAIERHRDGSSRSEHALGREPAGLPARQFAWEHTLSHDSNGNHVAPLHDRLLFLDVRPNVTAAAAAGLEAAFRSLERTFAWGPDGLLFSVGWGPHYFNEVLRTASPVPEPRKLSTFESPALDGYDVCIHLACDDESRLEAVDAALVRGRRLAGATGPLRVTGPLRWRETRTGFVGAGLPARHQRVAGIPPGSPVPVDSPLFMGFASGLLKNQASEDSVTIADGPFTGGTTMHVSYMHLNLQFWYDRNTERQRVQEMYAAQVTPAEVSKITTESPNHADGLEQAIIDYGVVGHSQTAARARRHGKPIILRRDFNTVDGGHAGLHFVSLQRSIEDFVTTRTAMNEAHAEFQNPVITNTSNNGINAYMAVLRRANYLVPSRRQRSFPLLPGRERHLP